MTTLPQPRRGRAALNLPARFAAVLGDYTEALRSAPLSDQTRRTHALFLNQRGQRLSVQGAHGVVTTIAACAGP